VVVHDIIHGGTTVLLPNEFAYAYFDYQRTLRSFITMLTAVENLRASNGPLNQLCVMTSFISRRCPVLVHEFCLCMQKGRGESIPHRFWEFLKLVSAGCC
jgi:hypothetical protein